jgi:hypothetical protein
LAASRSELLLVVAAEPGLTVTRGLRCLVVSRDALDLFDPRQLSGLVEQARAQVHCADLAGCYMVWIGNLPLVVGWCANVLAGRIGRLLAMVVGGSFQVPMMVWPAGWLRWAGWAFSCIIVLLSGGTLVSAGLIGAGLALSVGVPYAFLLRRLVAAESRRVERSADDATLAAGLGSELLEALELLALAEAEPTGPGVLGLLPCAGTDLSARCTRISQRLRRSG